MENVKLEDGQSADIISENISILKELFPGGLSEGRVDFDTLRQLLGDASVLDEGEEKYGLNWHGKKKARQIALTPSSGTLLPCLDESVDWENTQNLFIEGDNLEVLKLLQKSYANKIKMIYIDPPYNTGKDFVYSDNYQDNLVNYLKYTGQTSEEGRKLTSDVETSGRRHTNWLNMMYPRLSLAKRLLAKNGIIAVSISDQEQSNLRQIMDEIFGEDNFQGHLHWRRRHNQPNDKTKLIALVAEHILVYSRNSAALKASGVGKLPLTGKFSNADNDPRGDWASKPWKVGSDQSGSKYKITTPTGIELDGEWMGEEDSFKALLADNRIIFPKNGDGSPRKKYFKSEREDEGQCATNWWPHDQFGHNQQGSDEATELFGIKNVFSNPKPTKLIDGLISIANCKDGDLILDFFAGSGGVGQAVYQSDIELSFILVQIPEILDSKDKDQTVAHQFCLDNDLSPNIAEISKMRLRRAAMKIKDEDSEYKGDLGFKVFKLAESNIRLWNPDRRDLEESLFSHEEHLIDGRTEQDVLYELLLKRGVDLAVPIESREVSGKVIYSVGYGVLFACLDESISFEQVEDIAQFIITWYGNLAPSSDTHVFFRDSAFRDDVSKTNMAAILEQNGITHVRSL